MKVISPILIVLTAVLLTYPQNVISQIENSLYHSEFGQFSVSFPKTWDVQEREIAQIVGILTAVSPKQGDYDLTQESVNINFKQSSIKDLSELNTNPIEGMKQSAQPKLVSQDSGKIGQHSTSWLIFTFFSEEHTVKVIQYHLINADMIYTITCTALIETFEHYLPYFETIVASIIFD